MSAGSKVVPIRFPNGLMGDIGVELASRRDARKMKPINFSAWVRQACKEKIAHARRSRSRKPKDEFVAVDFSDTGDVLYEKLD